MQLHSFPAEMNTSKTYFVPFMLDFAIQNSIVNIAQFAVFFQNLY